MKPTSFPFSDIMNIQYFETLPSTNSTAAELAKKGAPHLTVVVAHTQTAGRGRLTRQFFSPKGGLYFTAVLRTALTPAQYGAVTPYAALAVHRAIRRTCGVCPAIKWVNDLLLHGKKICGILAESGSDQNGAPYILLGIGINTGDTVFPPELADIAASLPACDKDALLRAVLEELDGVERAVQSADWLDEYRAHSAVIGCEVNVIEGERTRRATALDITERGALSVRFENGTAEELFGAEISLRLTQ